MSKSRGIKDEFNHFADHWSGHGVHRIAISGNIIKKLFYTAALMTCTGLFAWQVQKLIFKFYQFPVNTKIEILHGPLEFPAVTICNKNVVRKSKIKEGGAEFQSVINQSQQAFVDQTYYNWWDNNWWGSGDGSGSGSDDDISSSTTGTPQSSTGTGDSFSSSTDSGSGFGGTETGSGNYYWDYWDSYWNDWGTEDDLFDFKDEEFFEPDDIPWLTEGQRTLESDAAQNITMALVRVNMTTRLKMGHQLREMLQSCDINGETCAAKNFSQFSNVLYGNCYTFNGFKTANNIKAFKSGPLFGLNMELVIEQDEYIGALTRTAGARLTIHDPYTFPFPEDDGIDLAPGKLTSVGIKLKVIEKLGAPYTDCTRGGGGVRMAYRGKYTVEACRKTCLQETIIKQCNCSDTRHANADSFRARACNETDYFCITQAEQQYLRDEKTCTCPQACRMTSYLQTVSTADFPSFASQGEVLETFIKRSDRMKEILNSTENVPKNLLQVQIFFESLQYEKITEIEAYGFENLLADIGGQAGLFIGCSVITLVEVLEFLGALLWVIVGKLFHRQAPPPSSNIVRVTPVQEKLGGKF